MMLDTIYRDAREDTVTAEELFPESFAQSPDEAIPALEDSHLGAVPLPAEMFCAAVWEEEQRPPFVTAVRPLSEALI